jgi:hypothetical protein
LHDPSIAAAQCHAEIGSTNRADCGRHPDVARRKTGVYLQPFSNPLGTTRVLLYRLFGRAIRLASRGMIAVLDRLAEAQPCVGIAPTLVELMGGTAVEP